MPDRSSAERRARRRRVGLLPGPRGGMRHGRPGASAPESAPKPPGTTTSRSSNTPRRSAPTPTTPTRGWRSNARSCARRRNTPSVAARSPRRTLRGSARRVSAGLGAEPERCPVDEALRDTRQKLRTKIAVTRNGKTELESLIERCARSAAAGTRPAGGRQAARLARFQRREQPQRLPIDRAVRGSERRLRSRPSATRPSTPTCAT